LQKGLLKSVATATPRGFSRPVRQNEGSRTSGAVYDSGIPKMELTPLVALIGPQHDQNLCMTAYGAERRHVTLSTNFRSPPETGHSRYGHPTARFAPLPSLREQSGGGMHRLHSSTLRAPF
jgi:hypothetical protein